MTNVGLDNTEIIRYAYVSTLIQKEGTPIKSKDQTYLTLYMCVKYRCMLIRFLVHKHLCMLVVEHIDYDQ